jgi:hypothetical protein
VKSTVDFQVYQVYFNKLSKSKLDPGFIPYNNTGVDAHNFENDIIKDVYLSKRKEWINADYVGIISWRFYEKSRLKSDEFYKKVIKSGYPVVSVGLSGNYKRESHPYTRKQYQSILDICKKADEYKLFDFNLLNYPVKTVIWCNYWVATPEIFELYCSKYLLKILAFFSENSNKDVLAAYNSQLKHRDQKPTYAMAFFLEGLFSVFLQEENIDNIQI